MFYDINNKPIFPGVTVYVATTTGWNSKKAVLRKGKVYRTSIGTSGVPSIGVLVEGKGYEGGPRSYRKPKNFVVVE